MDNKGVKVLVLTETPDYQKTLSACLQSSAFNLVVAENGKNLLEQTQEQMPDIVLLELRTPGNSAIKICRKLKDQKSTRAIPVFFMIPLPAIEELPGVFQAGAADYITIPFQKEEILSRFMVHLQTRNQSIELRQVKSRLNHGIEQQAAQLAETNRILKQKIAERDQAFESLQTSESKLKAVLDQSFGFIGLISLDGRVLEANQAALSFAGLNFEDVYNRYFWETPWWAHSHDFAMQLKSSVYQAAGGEVIRFEATHKSALGKIHHIDFSLQPIRDKNQKVFMLLAEGRDISELKNASEALAASHHYLDKIINTVADPILVKDRQHRWVLFNDAFCAYVGYPREQLMGKSDHDFFPKAEADVFHAKDEIVLTTGKENTNEEQVTNSRGSVRTVLTKKTRYVDEQGNPYVVAIIRDITESKRMENQLRQAQKIEAIGTLAGGIAHDFNNILTSVLGYAEFAIGKIKKGDHDVVNDLNVVFQAGNRAKRLVQQILQFSRQAETDFVPTEIGLIIKEALNLLRASLPTTIEIRTKIEPFKETVLADPSQIHQVIMNICTNAFHAMREGGVLTVELSKEELTPQVMTHDKPAEHGIYAVLQIGDSGHGMTAETAQRIFDPYFTTKSASEGTGLGLAVTKGIIKNHKGHISVHSEPEKGTTFTIFFPLTKAVEEKIPSDKQPVKGGNERILFVDDETSFVELGKKLLCGLGYEVTALSDSVRALETFTHQPANYDLVISDQTMPRMTGLMLAGEIHRIRPEMPVIICTGFSEAIEGKTAAQIGVSKILFKPTTKRDLSAAIREVLDLEKHSGH